MAVELYEMALRFRSEGFKAVEKDMNTLDKKGQGIAKAFTALKATLIVGAVGGLIRKIAVESIEAQKQTAQLNAVLKSTGGIAGVTADDIDKMAGSLQKTTTFSDEAVKSAASLLLTFTNIRGEIFKKTMPAILDLSQAMGTDLNTAAIQVGKALNDPLKGITALQRVGVSFSASQKETIKNLVETNRLAEAQGVILKELSVQFGGSAAAARNTLGGALASLGNAWDDLFEVTQDSSKGIIGAINSLTDNLPAVRQKFNSFFDNVGKGFTVLKVGYIRDAADIQRVWAFFSEASAKITFGRQKELLQESAKAMREEVRRLELEISNSLNRMGGGLFGDVTAGGSTTERTRKTVPPLGGSGTGTGKSKGVAIPDFDFGANIGSDVMNRIGEIGQSDVDVLAPLRARFEETPAELAKLIADLKGKIETGPLDQLWSSMGQNIKEGIANTIGDAVYNGFAAAFNGESLGGIFAAFGKTILAGFGEIIAQQGQAMIKAGVLLMAANIAMRNPISSGPGLILAGSALVGLAATFGAIAKGGGGGRGNVGGGHSYSSGYGSSSTENTRLKFVDRPITKDLEPVRAVINNFTIIGERDPRAQHAIERIIKHQNRRHA